MKRWTWIATTLFLSAALAGSYAALQRASPAGKAAAAGETASIRSSQADDNPLIVHEWGTFTSYSGSDGARLEFRPLFDNDLPPFVLDRSLGANLLSKTNYRALVRMETPVTYFYTRQPREVRVRVSFPQGLLTEFYPPVAALSPPYQPGKPEPAANSSLDWGLVQLIPETQLRPAIADPRLAEFVQQRSAAALPPAADVNNHYAYARQTDSALVHVHRPAKTNDIFKPHGDFFEKFLFYRGLGNFNLPLQATAPGEEHALVTNSGSEPIAWIMLLDVAPGKIRYAVQRDLAAGGQCEMSLPSKASSGEQMLADLTSALIETGLYEREAQAMVNTWKSSWFGEVGTRLLYFVPQPLTDKLLPLDIQPPPDAMVRVLVGRLDLMTPEREQAVL